ncbi:MAG: sterol desaturase family protein [Leptospiraceae bacterium]|nr:sterol desaturase family protein [Leptospiraceae bacterium]MCP5512350.1 sterol desaturase family protein [Leptospiraceae bacterium]
MKEWIFENATYLRLGIFVTLFLSLAIWEILIPDHKPVVERKKRWPANILLVLLDNLLVRLFFPITAILLSERAIANKWGLLQLYDVPEWLAVPIAIILLDMIIYIQHVIFHSIPILWKLHQMHHQDLDLDVTSGTRFHPIEIFISMVIKFMAIVSLGAPPLAVFLFEVVLNGMAMFNHSNIYIPERIEKFLRYFIVTPYMHRIHHSVHIDEYNTNFGFNLSVWDRWMGTLKNDFRGELTLGLNYFRKLYYSRLDYLLLMPFLKKDQEK